MVDVAALNNVRDRLMFVIIYRSRYTNIKSVYTGMENGSLRDWRVGETVEFQYHIVESWSRKNDDWNS